MELAAVLPGPGVFFAARGFSDVDTAVGRVVVGADTRVFGVAVEDETAAIGLDDLHCAVDGIQFGFVAQFPAAPKDAYAVVGAAKDAVVVPHNL